MEKFNNHESERNWKKFYYQLGERAIELCQSETILFSHSEEYSHYDLIQNPIGLISRIDNEELYDALYEEEFSEFFQQYPSPVHEQAMNEHWQREAVEGAELILDIENR